MPLRREALKRNAVASNLWKNTCSSDHLKTRFFGSASKGWKKSFQPLEKWITFFPVKKLNLITGWAHGPSSLQPLANRLSKTFDVHILSGTDVLAGQKIPDSEFIVGWSLGGMLALERLPKTCKKLALISSTARFCSDEDYDCGTPEETAQQISTFLRRRPATVLPGIAEKIYGAHAIPDFPPADAADLDVLNHDLDYLLNTDLRKTVSGIQIPTLLLHGTEDAMIPATASTWLHEHLPDSQLELFPGEGHAIALQNPDLIAEPILRFFSHPEDHIIEKRFSTAAATYDRHSRPQQALIDELVCVLPKQPPSRILELGCGTGLLTRLLAEHYPDSPIDASDISPGMIEHCRDAFSNQPQISWVVADAQTFQTDTPYPLIVSTSALHWTDDLTQTFIQAYQNLEVGGTFALGMMLQGTLRELRELREKIAPEKVFTTRLPTFEETIDALKTAGFSIRKSNRFDRHYNYANARAFFRVIHEQGVTGGSLERGYVPLTRKEIRTLIESYQKEFESDLGVCASYETALFIAEKK